MPRSCLRSRDLDAITLSKTGTDSFSSFSWPQQPRDTVSRTFGRSKSCGKRVWVYNIKALRGLTFMLLGTACLNRAAWGSSKNFGNESERHRELGSFLFAHSLLYNGTRFERIWWRASPSHGGNVHRSRREWQENRCWHEKSLWVLGRSILVIIGLTIFKVIWWKTSTRACCIVHSVSSFSTRKTVFSFSSVQVKRSLSRICGRIHVAPTRSTLPLNW